MPKYIRLDGEKRDFPEWVVNSLDPIIVNGKQVPNGGWKPHEEADEDTQKVLDETKTKTTKTTKTKTTTKKAGKTADAKKDANPDGGKANAPAAEGLNDLDDLFDDDDADANATDDAPKQ